MSKSEQKTRTKKVTGVIFEGALKEATEAFSTAEKKFKNVQSLVEQMQTSLVKGFTKAAKTFGTTINPDRLQAFIEAFVEKPYFVIPMSEREWWLVVPSFVTLEFGYLLAQEGAWNIFVVNQYSDMIQDIPEEFRREIELAKPFGQMEIKGDKLILQSIEDDAREVKATFKEFLGAVKDKKTILIQKGKEFDLLAALIRQGILPFKINKVKEKHKYKESRFTGELRDYQLKDYGIFENHTGAIGLTYPMGGGKSLPPLKAISDLIGKKLILVPNATLAENWRKYVLEFTEIPEDQIATDFSEKHLAESLEKEVHIVIYNEKNLVKIKNQIYIFACFDEAPSMITKRRIDFVKLNIEYRMTCTGTPFREDGNEDLIFALMVKPLGVDWQYFIENDLIKTPEIKIWVEPDEEAKLIRLGELIDHTKKTLIFCDSKKLGYSLSERYGIPFVSGDIKDAKERLQIIEDNNVVIVSRVADMGISVKDLEMIIEVDFLFGSRQQEAQRVGRLFHSKEEGVYHALTTAYEYMKYRKRFLELYRQGLKVKIEKSSELPFDLTHVADQVKGVGKRKAIDSTKTEKIKKTKKEKKPKYDPEILVKECPISEDAQIDEKLVMYILSTSYALKRGGLSTTEMRAAIEANKIKSLLQVRHIEKYSITSDRKLAVKKDTERKYWLSLYQLINTMYNSQKIERRTEGNKKIYFIMDQITGAR